MRKLKKISSLFFILMLFTFSFGASALADKNFPGPSVALADSDSSSLPKKNLIVANTVNNGQFQFSAATYSKSEASTTATITVRRVDGSTGAVGVTYTTSNGTATAGTDYLTTSGTLTFPAGKVTKTFKIPITNDNDVESKETVIITLSAPTGGATLGTPSQATLTIVDNDKLVSQRGQFQFSAATYSESEAAPTATIMVSRVNGSTGAVGVTYATSNGTATAGSDYTNATGTLAFAVGEVSKTFTVPIKNDTARESNETVILTLSDPTGGATIGTPSKATLTITDLPSNEILYSNFSTSESAITLGSDAIPGKLNVGIRGNTDISSKKHTKNIIVKATKETNESEITLQWPNGEGYSTNGVFDEITGVGFSSQTTINIPARVVITFDDGWSSVYSKAYQYMRQKGMKGTAYIVPTLLDTQNYMTSAQVQELHDNGWCIANHTYNHRNMSSYSKQKALSEMQAWQQWAQSKGYVSGMGHIAFPNGAYNDSVIDACRDLGIVTGRKVGNALNSDFDMYGNTKLLTPLTCGLGGGSPNAVAVNTQIAKAVSQGKVAILMFHRIVDVAGENGSSTTDGMNFVYSNFQQVIDYCNNNGILVETMDEFYNALNKSISDVTDVQKRLEFDTNYNCVTRCGKILLDGTLNWTAPTVYQNNVYRAYITGWAAAHPDVSHAVGSNHTNFNDLQEFKSVDAIKGSLPNKYQVAIHTNGNLYISIDKAYLDANGGGNIVALKNYLNVHPITMIYQRITPVTQQIDVSITTNGEMDTSLRGWGENTVIRSEPAMNGDTTSSIPVLIETHRE